MKLKDKGKLGVLNTVNKFFQGKEMCISIMSEGKGFTDPKDDVIVMDKYGVKGIVGHPLPVTVCVSKQEIVELFYKKIRKAKNKYFKK